MIQQADIESYHRGQEDIGRGYAVHEAKEDTGRDDAPFGLDHPAKKHFFGKARQERDKEDIDYGGRSEEGSYVTGDGLSHGAYNRNRTAFFR